MHVKSIRWECKQFESTLIQFGSVSGDNLWMQEMFDERKTSISIGQNERNKTRSWIDVNNVVRTNDHKRWQ